MSPEQPEKGQKRKRQEEEEEDVCSEEPVQSWKKLKQEQHETELGDEEPDKSQIWTPQEKGPLQLMAPECAKGPEEEAVTEESGWRPGSQAPPQQQGGRSSETPQ